MSYRTTRLAASLHKGAFLILLFVSAFLIATRVGICTASQPLEPLLAGSVATLTPGETYTLTYGTNVGHNFVLNGQGATIILQSGPLGVNVSGRALTVNDCVLEGQGWGTLGAWNGGHLIINGSTVRNPGHTGIFADGARVTISESTIRDCDFGINAFGATDLDFSDLTITGCTRSVQVSAGTLDWSGGSLVQPLGVAVHLGAATGTFSGLEVLQNGGGSISFNFHGQSGGSLHGVTVIGSDMPVQIHSGDVLVDGGCIFVGGTGAGIAVNMGGSLILRDSEFSGFLNSVDLQPGYPATADISGCHFVKPGASAVSAVNASHVRLADSIVEDATFDGIYFFNTPGLVENSRILRSMNTGVTFMECVDGIVMRNCVVADSAHQGATSVKTDLAEFGTGSHNVHFLHNLFVNNVITNLLVDSFSSAYVEGNIFVDAPDASLRLHGTQGTVLRGNLVVDSRLGFEVKESANPLLALSRISDHTHGGILLYDYSDMTLRSNDVQSNSLGGDGSYSLFVNWGAVAHLRGNAFGPAGELALYNNAGALSDAAWNFWSAPNGPDLHQGEGSGARVRWNASNLSSVSTHPFLEEAAVMSRYTRSASLRPGRSLSWDSQLGVSIGLIGGAEGVAVDGGILGVLHCLDAGHLGDWPLPDHLAPGGIHVVWVDPALRANAATGRIGFQLPGLGPVASLVRWMEGTGWESVYSVWHAESEYLEAFFEVPEGMNGIYAVVAAAGPKFNAASAWSEYE